MDNSTNREDLGQPMDQPGTAQSPAKINGMLVRSVTDLSAKARKRAYLEYRRFFGRLAFVIRPGIELVSVTVLFSWYLTVWLLFHGR